MKFKFANGHSLQFWESEYDKIVISDGKISCIRLNGRIATIEVPNQWMEGMTFRSGTQPGESVMNLCRSRISGECSTRSCSGFGCNLESSGEKKSDGRSNQLDFKTPIRCSKARSSSGTESNSGCSGRNAKAEDSAASTADKSHTGPCQSIPELEIEMVSNQIDLVDPVLVEPNTGTNKLILYEDTWWKERAAKAGSDVSVGLTEGNTSLISHFHNFVKRLGKDPSVCTAERNSNTSHGDYREGATREKSRQGGQEEYKRKQRGPNG